MHILSITTTPPRINNAIKNLYTNANNYYCFYKVVINICNKYKRFDNSQAILDKASILMLKELNIKYKNKFVLNAIYDYGPLSKLIGGYYYLYHNNLTNSNIIIADDDIAYNYKLFSALLNSKNENNIVGTSGFNYYKLKIYDKVKNGNSDIIEGFAGICISYKQIKNSLLLNFAKYYKILDKSNNVFNNYLLAAFLGDDFIISNFFKNKLIIEADYLKIYKYGYGSDALQNNNVFGGNMATYEYLTANFDIFKTIIKKLKVNNQIKNINI